LNSFDPCFDSTSLKSLKKNIYNIDWEEKNKSPKLPSPKFKRNGDFFIYIRLFSPLFIYSAFRTWWNRTKQFIFIILYIVKIVYDRCGFRNFECSSVDLQTNHQFPFKRFQQNSIKLLFFKYQIQLLIKTLLHVEAKTNSNRISKMNENLHWNHGCKKKILFNHLPQPSSVGLHVYIKISNQFYINSLKVVIVKTVKWRYTV
jgi:hypothetical protein